MESLVRSPMFTGSGSGFEFLKRGLEASSAVLGIAKQSSDSYRVSLIINHDQIYITAHEAEAFHESVLIDLTRSRLISYPKEASPPHYSLIIGLLKIGRLATTYSLRRLSKTVQEQ